MFERYVLLNCFSGSVLGYDIVGIETG